MWPFFRILDSGYSKILQFLYFQRHFLFGCIKGATPSFWFVDVSQLHLAGGVCNGCTWPVLQPPRTNKPSHRDKCIVDKEKSVWEAGVFEIQFSISSHEWNQSHSPDSSNLTSFPIKDQLITQLIKIFKCLAAWPFSQPVSPTFEITFQVPAVS